jgi:copper chaperone CopZ
MKTDTVVVANLKCAGCETSIINKISKMSGVMKVKVVPEKDQVEIRHEGKTERKQFVNALNALGYPEATEDNGLLMQLKSYVSCALGKMKM